MDCMPQDLRDALDEAHSDAKKQADAEAPVDPHQCSRCHSVPAPGNKLRYCGRCETLRYCSKLCAQADWERHKLACDGFRKHRDEALAAFKAQGGREQDFNKNAREVIHWFENVPGLGHEITLLAWASRSEDPLIHVTTLDDDADGSGVRIQVIPRSFWDEDIFPDVFFREGLRQKFDESWFCSNTMYVCQFTSERPDKQDHTIRTTQYFTDGTVRGTEIVEALTAATRAADLSDAFDWFETFLPSHTGREILQAVRIRSDLVHGSNTPHGSVPVPSRSTNNEVAYTIMSCLSLTFEIRLTGLHCAAQLNGREGTIHGNDPANPERWKARLDDGTCVSVKAINFLHIRHGNYKRVSS